MAGLVLQLRVCQDAININARVCDQNFSKVGQSLRLSAEAIRGIGDTLRDERDEGESWKNGRSE